MSFILHDQLSVCLTRHFVSRQCWKRNILTAVQEIKARWSFTREETIFQCSSSTFNLKLVTRFRDAEYEQRYYSTTWGGNITEFPTVCCRCVFTGPLGSAVKFSEYANLLLIPPVGGSATRSVLPPCQQSERHSPQTPGKLVHPGRKIRPGSPPLQKPVARLPGGLITGLTPGYPVSVTLTLNTFRCYADIIWIKKIFFFSINVCVVGILTGFQGKLCLRSIHVGGNYCSVNTVDGKRLMKRLTG